MGVARTPPKANRELGRESVAVAAQGSVSPLQEDQEIQKFPSSWYLPSSFPGPTPPSLVSNASEATGSLHHISSKGVPGITSTSQSLWVCPWHLLCQALSETTFYINVLLQLSQ